MPKKKQEQKTKKMVKKTPKQVVKKPIAAPEAPQAQPKDDQKKRGAKVIQPLRGMKEILPKDDSYWTAFLHKTENIARAFGFRRLITPTLEEASLFVRAVGKGTDIVDKEMYIFEDSDLTRVALRPEITAGVVRSYISNGMHVLPQPVKVWNVASVFRHERPQAGRYREHRQADFEILGDSKPVTDAEVILAAYSLLTELGLSVEVRLNSIGTPEDRVRFKMELVSYYRSKRGYLCDDCKKRLVRNPLRLLDCKKEQCQPIKEEAPQIIDWLSEPSKAHFTKVLEYLDELQVPYTLDHTLVRGLDYYTHTLFEIYTTEPLHEETAQSALCGGGRYDLLTEMLGGSATPAVGFGMGVERVVHELKERRVEVPLVFQHRVYLAQLGEQASRRALKLLNDLRHVNIQAGHNFGKTSLKAQLELADKYGSEFCIIIGQKEVVDGVVIVRDMESGIQEIIAQDQIVPWLEKKLASTPPSTKKIKEEAVFDTPAPVQDPHQPAPLTIKHDRAAHDEEDKEEGVDAVFDVVVTEPEEDKEDELV